MVGGARRTESNAHLQDLVLHPSSIDDQLNNLITEWQTAILEYENLEISFREEMGDTQECIRLLHELKESPSTFKRFQAERIKGSPLLNDLVKKFIRSQELQNKLPVLQEHGDPNFDLAMQRELELSGGHGTFMTKVSSTWSSRLNAINPTQGGVQLADSMKVENMRVRPRWPRYLTDICYDVIKVNKYGHRMRRVLKLTQHHIISVKNGGELTKFYPYHDVRRTFILQQTTLKVVQRNGKINTYLSPAALHIFQQIVTRVKVRKALDATDLQGEMAADSNDAVNDCGFNVSATAEIIKAISEANAASAEEVLTNFAHELKQRTVHSIAEDAKEQDTEEGDGITNTESDVATNNSTFNGADNQTESDSGKVSSSNNSSAKEYPSPIPGPPMSPSNSMQSPKALMKSLKLSYPENSAEGAVQAQIRALLFDPSTPEGSTLAHFVRGFEVNPNEQLNAALLKVRHFIDGLHEYCLDSRSFALCVVYQQHTQRNLTTGANGSSSISNGTSPTQSPMQKQSSAMNNNPTSTPGNSTALMSRTSLRFLKEQQIGHQTVDPDTLTLLSLIIFLAVEEAVFLSLRTTIVRWYNLQNNYLSDNSAILSGGGGVRQAMNPEEQKLHRSMKRLRARTQEQWGVPPHLVSSLGWRTAIFELSNLEHDLTPSVQLQVLTRTVKAVYNEFKYAVLPRLSPAEQATACIAADDLVPIFLFVFCQQRDLKHCLQNRDLMWALCHPDQLRGEAGYYLTVYESAIECVLTETDRSSLAAFQPSFSTRSTSSESSSGHHSNRLSDRHTGARSSFSSAAIDFLRRLSGTYAVTAESRASASHNSSHRNSQRQSQGHLSQGSHHSAADQSAEASSHPQHRSSTRHSRSDTVENPLVRALRLSVGGDEDDPNIIRESFA